VAAVPIVSSGVSLPSSPMNRASKGIETASATATIECAIVTCCSCWTERATSRAEPSPAATPAGNWQSGARPCGFDDASGCPARQWARDGVRPPGPRAVTEAVPAVELGHGDLVRRRVHALTALTALLAAYAVAFGGTLVAGEVAYGHLESSLGTYPASEQALVQSIAVICFMVFVCLTVFIPLIARSSDPTLPRWASVAAGLVLVASRMLAGFLVYELVVGLQAIGSIDIP
jgi:hypothetical protein